MYATNYVITLNLPSSKATAKTYLQIWLEGVVAQDNSHLLSTFGDEESSGMIYNMYADSLLGLGLIPSKVSAY